MAKTENKQALTDAERQHLVDQCLLFVDVLSDTPLYPYQRPFSRRIIESVLVEDSATVTALFSRQCLDGDTVVFRRNGTAVRLREHEDAFQTGVKPTKTYRMRGGAEVTMTDNHPIYTPDGWSAAGLLQPGDKVAAVINVPTWLCEEVIEREIEVDRHKTPLRVSVPVDAPLARFLGYMTTDGSNRPGQSLKFTNCNPLYLSEMSEISEKCFGIIPKPYVKGNGYDLLFTTSKSSWGNPLRDLYRALVWDHKFPLDVFRWNPEITAEFVNRAWSGDGCISMKKSGPDVFLACGNDEVYARYWQALLLKYGVQSTVKKEWMNKGTAPFFRLVVGCGAMNIRRFFSSFGLIYGKEEKSASALDYFDAKKGSPGGKGRTERCMMPYVDTAIDGEKIGWTTVVSIEDAGVRPVYDMEVPEKGWFVAQNLMVSNSGKSETVANTVAALLILLPRLAQIYPTDPILSKFKRGFWVGLFAPVEEQANTLFSRLVDRLTCDHAQSILADPEVDDVAVGKARNLRLKKCGSFALMMTANPKAKIESKTFHLVVLDECQDISDFVISKSVAPMLSATGGTSVRTGTPNTRKSDFLNTIKYNKRAALTQGGKQNHFEADWREVGKYNPRYKKYVEKEIERLGEDSQEIQMAYNLKWMLDKGMFTTETRMDELGDTSQQELVKTWTRTPVVVGVDPAKTTDSTVVTVVWVDWDRPDEFGLYPHRILNWLEIQGNLEDQYPQIVNFLEPYSIFSVAVDNQGMGIAVTERLGVLLRHKNCEIVPMNSTASDQNKRWKHLTTLMDRGLLGWPAGAKVRRLRTFRRFYQQMTDAEKSYVGPNIRVQAPDEAGAHDDYVDSAALACYLTADFSAPEAEMSSNPFYG